MNDIAKKLRKLRDDRDLTRNDVEQMTGITVSNLNNYECGRRRIYLDNAITLAKFYNVSLDWLCGIADNQIDNPDIIALLDIAKKTKTETIKKIVKIIPTLDE